MWNGLLEIYQESRLNGGKPECLFAETLIFNEGWLLRSVLKAWKTGATSTSLPFLPFPRAAKLYSEGQLRTPFKAQYMSDPQAETHSHADGLAGFFSIQAGTKSGIQLDPGCRYIAALEAKLYSPLSKGVKAAPEYDQISRTAACLIHALLGAGTGAGSEAHLVVLYPEGNTHIDPKAYGVDRLRERIGKRLAAYRAAGASTPEIERFEAGWEEMLDPLKVHFETWEDVLAEIDDEDLTRFYGLCMRFGG